MGILCRLWGFTPYYEKGNLLTLHAKYQKNTLEIEKGIFLCCRAVKLSTKHSVYGGDKYNEKALYYYGLALANKSTELCRAYNVLLESQKIAKRVNKDEKLLENISEVLLSLEKQALQECVVYEDRNFYYRVIPEDCGKSDSNLLRKKPQIEKFQGSHAITKTSADLEPSQPATNQSNNITNQPSQIYSTKNNFSIFGFSSSLSSDTFDATAYIFITIINGEDINYKVQINNKDVSHLIVEVNPDPSNEEFCYITLWGKREELHIASGTNEITVTKANGQKTKPYQFIQKFN